MLRLCISHEENACPKYAGIIFKSTAQPLHDLQSMDVKTDQFPNDLRFGDFKVSLNTKPRITSGRRLRGGDAEEFERKRLRENRTLWFFDE